MKLKRFYIHRTEIAEAAPEMFLVLEAGSKVTEDNFPDFVNPIADAGGCHHFRRNITLGEATQHMIDKGFIFDQEFWDHMATEEFWDDDN